MENTPKTMPGALTLVVDAMKLYTSTWSASTKVSIYFLYVGLVVFASAALVKVHEAFLLLDALVSLGAGVATVWISIQLYHAMLNLESGKQPLPQAEASKKAWSLLLSFFWVSLLVGLATIGGTILLILPGIYLAIAFSFSAMILVDKGTRGTQALAASRALVKGRWWGTFWRLLIGGIVLGIIIGFVVGIPAGILGGIAGPEAMGTEFGQSADPLIEGIVMLIQYVAQAALMPLMVGFSVKVYRALLNTR